MIRCIAIDDEPLALIVIKELCKEVEWLKLERTYTDTEEAARYIRQFPVDLIFLDIQMPEIDGLRFYKKYGQDIPVIFTTAFSQYAVEGFNVNAVDYLLKPIEKKRFHQAVNKAREFIHFLHAAPQHEKNILVRSNYALVKINMEDIQYIETLDDYLKIHTLSSKKPVLTKMNLKNMAAQLDEAQFVRIHRSYIVNLKCIDAVRGKNVFLGPIELPIGHSFEADFFGKYKSWLPTETY